MLKSFFLLLSLFIGSLSMAQTAAKVAANGVHQLFDKPQKIKWVQHFKGRIDDLNDIAVSLAFDGKNCKGTLTYLRSKVSFKLDGSFKNNEFKLKEIDQHKQTSGHLEGKLMDGRVIGEWSNHDRSTLGSFILEKVDRPVEFPSYCGNNKWIHHYTGKHRGEKAEIILQKDIDDHLKGILYLASSNKSYNVNGYLENNGLFVLDMADDLKKETGKIAGSLVDANSLHAAFTKTNGKTEMAKFELEKELSVGCIEFADYMSSYDITYPKLYSRQFNDWIDEISNSWIYACKKYSANVKKKNTKEKPDLRASLRAYAWTDLDLINERLVSGFITFSNTWSVGMKGQSFNFDLKSGEEITFDDLFLPEFDYRRFLWNEMNRTLKYHPNYKEEGFRKWVVGLEFPYFTIRNEGISFCSDFNAIYGQQRLTVSYDDLKPYLRKKNPINFLLKGR